MDAVFTTIRWIVSSDQRRKVQLVKRSDGTFGFQEWKFSGDEGGYWAPTRIGACSRCASAEEALREAEGRVEWLVAERPGPGFYQLGWTTLPGLRGLSVSGFRATPTEAPDNDRGVAMEFATEAARDAFLSEIENAFASRRFTNAADAFDIVKAYVIEHTAKR